MLGVNPANNERLRNVFIWSFGKRSLNLLKTLKKTLQFKTFLKRYNMLSKRWMDDSKKLQKKKFQILKKNCRNNLIKTFLKTFLCRLKYFSKNVLRTFEKIVLYQRFIYVYYG